MLRALANARRPSRHTLSNVPTLKAKASAWRGGFPEFPDLRSQNLAPSFLAWQVFLLSESPCTEIGLRWQVSRLSEPPCRQFDTATRETCRRSPETRARRRSNSENPPRGARNAARRPANSENPPARGLAATETRKTCQPKRRRLQQLGKPARSEGDGYGNSETCPAKRRRLQQLGKPANSKVTLGASLCHPDTIIDTIAFARAESNRHKIRLIRDPPAPKSA